MTMDDAPLQPQPPDPLDSFTLDQLASTIDACVAALRAGEDLRGIDPLLVLRTLAELLRASAQGP